MSISYHSLTAGLSLCLLAAVGPAARAAESGPASDGGGPAGAIDAASSAAGAAAQAKDSYDALKRGNAAHAVDLDDVMTVPVWLPLAFSGYQVGEFFRVYDGYRALNWIQYIGYAYAGLFTLYTLAFPTYGTNPDPLEVSYGLDYSLYLLDTKRKGALTGAAAKRAEGLGLGSHFDFTKRWPVGLSLSVKGDWQQSNLDVNDFMHLTNFFYKFEPMLGLDLARVLAQQASGGFSHWLASCRLEGRIGPSVFGDFLRVGDRYGGPVRFYDNLSASFPLMQGLGWEYSGLVDIDLYLLHVQGYIEGAQYPSLRYPRLTATNYRMARMVSFEALRGQDSYRWQRYRLTIDTPIPWLVGKRWSDSASIKGGYEILKLSGNKGEGLNNQAYTISASWGF
jgi:hypothetical protein